VEQKFRRLAFHLPRAEAIAHAVLRGAAADPLDV
jgi:hypothetical protein